MKKHQKNKTHALRFKRILDWRLIPEYLITQIKGTDWTPEKFITYQANLEKDPNNLNFALVEANDDNETIRGFCWAYCDELKEVIYIHGLSVDRKYQNRKIIPFTKRFFEMLVRKSDNRIKNVYWFSDRPKAYEKHGFLRSKYVLMSLYKE